MSKTFWKVMVPCVAVLVIAVLIVRRDRADSDVSEKADSISQENSVSQKDVVAERGTGTSEEPKSAVLLPPSVIKVGEVTMPDATTRVSGRLQKVMGIGEKRYYKRVEIVHALRGEVLERSEIEALYTLLNRNEGEDPLDLNDLNGLKNDVLNLVRTQKPHPADLTPVLVKMFNDPDHDDAWRDYCIQHLGAMYSVETNQEYHKAIEDLLWHVVDDKESNTAGTALIALENNIKEQDIDKQAVVDKAFALSVSSETIIPVKMTSLQVSVHLGDKRILDHAREIAESDASIPLRMSAIAALGALGDKSDMEVIKNLQSSDEKRLQNSVQAAATLLAKRYP